LTLKIVESAAMFGVVWNNPLVFNKQTIYFFNSNYTAELNVWSLLLLIN